MRGRAVLMVVQLYPPGGGSSGVLRPLKFSRFLPGHGWTPHVLTLRPHLYRVKDETLVGQIPPEAVVHRTLAVDTRRHLAVRGRRLGALEVPDQFIGWIPFAIGRGLHVIRQHPIRALYSTSPPATAHLIAGILARLTRLPWVADFRDPWIEEGTHPRPGSFRYGLESALERWVVRGATRLVVTTPALGAEIVGRHPEISSDKVAVVFNGYDEDDFGDFAPQVSREHFEIIHTGFLNADFRDPRPLLRALGELIAEGLVPRHHARVSLLGVGGWVRSAPFRESVAQLGLTDVVRVEPSVPHAAAIQRLAGAGALLLVQASNDTRALIPAKAFEYLRTGLPILALTFDGATADLLKGMEQCFVVHPSDHLTLRRTLLTLYETWRGAMGTSATPRRIQRYERRCLTGQLARLLDDFADRGQR